MAATTPMEFIHELYVVQDSGVCLYHKSFSDASKAVDETIISSFLSAIETFSNNFDSSVHKLSLRDFDFIYHREGELIYVVKAVHGVDDIAVVKALSLVGKDFRQNYLKDKELNGDVRAFKVIGKLFINHLLFNRSVVHRGSKFEISGKIEKITHPGESKIYAILRLRGRLDIATISSLMKIPEDETIRLTKSLMDRKLVTHCR